MGTNCQMVVFTNRAYNAIISESFAKDPLETGGILLGHVLDNGVWIVMEVLPPGIDCIFRHAYFEYDAKFVNYLAQSVADQYKTPLDLLGLWHRHPGNMDFFSTTDDGTNTTFAKQNPYGVISGIVNIDPQFRMTMYHLGNQPAAAEFVRPAYERINFEVGDDIIPEEYFKLRNYNGDNNDTALHPTPVVEPQHGSDDTTQNPDGGKEIELPGSGGGGDSGTNVRKWPAIVAIAVFLICVGIVVKCASNNPKPGKEKGEEKTEMPTDSIIPHNSTQITTEDTLTVSDSSLTEESIIDI